MSIKQWFRSMFGLPSPDASREERGKLDQLPDSWSSAGPLYAEGTDVANWREQGRHGESLEEFRLRRASERKPGHPNVSRAPRSRLDDVGRHSTPPARGITPDAAHARQERFDAMYRADDSGYQRARQRELDAYEEGVRDQATGDFVEDLIQSAAANEAIEAAEDRAERAEERLEQALYEREPDNDPAPAYEPPAPEPAQQEYQAPEPSYPTPDPSPSYDPGPSAYDSGSNPSGGGDSW
jgi:hypothetical protein